MTERVKSLYTVCPNFEGPQPSNTVTPSHHHLVDFVLLCRNDIQMYKFVKVPCTVLVVKLIAAPVHIQMFPLETPTL